MFLKKIKISIPLFIFLGFFSVCHASLKIVEVMYDPDGSDENREWVKVYNDSDNDINIIGGKSNSSWKFIDKATHYINDSITISPHEYGVLASDKDTFLSEYSSYYLPVADTTMSLGNTSGVVQISDGVNIISSFSYPSSSSSELDEVINEDSDNNTHSLKAESKEDKDDIKILKITTKINFPKIITSGVPFSFYSTTTDNSEITHNVGKFIWNFGDGSSLDTKDYGPYSYTYEYPGDYVVNLSYYDNSFTEIPDATDKINVKVVSADIFISGVGSVVDPYIEIQNKSKYDVDVSGWAIATTSKNFIFPKNTIFLKNNKIRLSQKVTSFESEDLKYFIIQNKRGDIVATYPSKKINTMSSSNNVSVNSDSVAKDNDVINLNDLGASASDYNQISGKYTYFLLLIVILLGVISFILFKKKKTNIIDIEKEVSSSDFKILE